MALDIIETKLFKEPKETIKICIPKYRCNLSLSDVSLLILSIFLKLRLKEVCGIFPFNFDISDFPMVVYTLSPSIRSTIFNYKQFVLHLNIEELLKHPH